jgi:hypothetical protein
MAVRRGEIEPWQASQWFAQLSGQYPFPGGSALGERATDTGADALVGNVVTLTRTNPRATISMPAGQRASGSPTLNLTMSVIGVKYDVQIPPSTVYKNSVKGIVEFGAGGGAHTIEFDPKRGAQLSLIGQSPAISAELEDPTDPNSPSEVTISASIGAGSRAARAFNTRTFPPRTVTSGLSLFAQVPQFAYGFIPFADDPNALAPGATTIQFWSFAGFCPYTTGGLYGVPPPPVLVTGQLVATLNGSDFAGARVSEGMILPQGADLITITNNLDDPIQWTPCFSLSV